MTGFRKKLLLISIHLVGFLIFSLMVIFGNKSSRKFRMELFEIGYYTIGTVVKKVSEPRVTYYIYRYQFENKTYEGKYIGKGLKINGNYFLIFNPAKPKDKYLLGDFPVPDSITTAPSNGWEEIPIPINMEELRKYLESGKND